MLSKVKSFGLNGIDGFLTQIETDIVGGVPHFEIVGLGDTAVKESKDRVKSAIRNSALEYPVKHYTINLAPADVKTEAIEPEVEQKNNEPVDNGNHVFCPNCGARMVNSND